MDCFLIEFFQLQFRDYIFFLWFNTPLLAAVSSFCVLLIVVRSRRSWHETIVLQVLLELHYETHNQNKDSTS